MPARDWKIYRGGSAPDKRFRQILNDERYCPEWRNFSKRHYPDRAGREQAIARSGPAPEETDARGGAFVPAPEMIEMVNAALYLRRPLLVRGKPGIGKSSLIYSVARELKLKRVLRWPINSRTALCDGKYQYDAIGRLQQWQLKKMGVESTGQQDASVNPTGQQDAGLDIGEYLRLGPLGTAMLPWEHPRALLIDEIDKGDPDLANDLLDVLEEGEFEIPELARLGKHLNHAEIPVPTADGGGHMATIVNGQVRCLHFPVVILTSNDERDFPPAFKRRCLHLEVKEPEPSELWAIVESHLGEGVKDEAGKIIKEFDRLRKEGLRTNDQLLQAVFLLTREYSIDDETYRKELLGKLLSPLTRP